MSITRRDFLTASSTLAAAWTASPIASAQEAITGEGNRNPTIPTRPAKVERLFKAPDAHPNALESASDGLWIGDQVSERVFKVDWQSGQVLHQVQTESHNTSGLAVGGGYLWLNANGGVSGRRPPRPADKPFGEIVQADIETGKTVKVFRPPWRGGLHGITWVEQTHTLWSVALNISALAELDPKDNLRIVRMIPVKGDRPHGLDWQDGTIWCLFAGDRVVHRLDPDSGKILEVITLSRTSDPDPHGMCIHDAYMYYCDAGLTAPGPGSEPSMVGRFKLA